MAKKDYIEREAMVKESCERCHEGECVPCDKEHCLLMEVIYSIPAADVVSGKDFRDCRNELCLRRGNYKQRHLGACDGCRWRDAE